MSETSVVANCLRYKIIASKPTQQSSLNGIKAGTVPFVQEV
jgi:hypothetical protein